MHAFMRMFSSGTGMIMIRSLMRRFLRSLGRVEYLPHFGVRLSESVKLAPTYLCATRPYIKYDVSFPVAQCEMAPSREFV